MIPTVEEIEKSIIKKIKIYTSLNGVTTYQDLLDVNARATAEVMRNCLVQTANDFIKKIINERDARIEKTIR